MYRAACASQFTRKLGQNGSRDRVENENSAGLAAGKTSCCHVFLRARACAAGTDFCRLFFRFVVVGSQGENCKIALFVPILVAWTC